MADFVIISMHEKGFPSADLYQGHSDTPPDEFERIAPSPDSFFTMKRGDTLMDAYEKALEKWPSAIIMIADEPEEDEE